MDHSTGVTVERLTARWTDRAAPGVDERQARRVWLSTLLAGCDLLPPSMPPSATLVVRKLPDPLPGRIARSRHAVRPEPEWEQAVRQALGDLWRRAPRPGRAASAAAHGAAGAGGAAGAVASAAPTSAAVPDSVPDDAEAVFFLDAAELTACLAADLAEGTAAAHWWWRELLPTGGGARLFTVLSRQPELLPMVIAYLAAGGKARTVVGALARSEALLLALAMAGAYGLPDWRSGPVAALAFAGPAHAGAAGVVRPWAPEVDRLVAGLGKEQAALLGLGLTLAGSGRPNRQRLSLPALAEALAIWWEETAVEVTAARIPPEAADQRTPQPIPASSSADSSVPAPTAAPAASMSGPAAAAQQDEAVSPEAWPLPAALAPEGVATRIGGVLYLINVLRRLGFPEAFPGEIGPWALLEALARAMLPGGDPFAELAGDPLWAALALLDGREPRTLPGAELDSQIPLPPDWPVLPPVSLGETLAAEIDPALAAWLARAVPHIDRYLQEALQMQEPIPHLLLVPGRLHVTATHVELTMDLERISVPVRMAGLDQNPGWQAPFRRVILFHFR